MEKLVICIVLGFFAQLIDGTAGMAYGICSNTFLRMMGIPSAVSSACVHCAEIFTTLVSGISHIKLKNVHPKLFFMLLFPGVIGGVTGACLLVNFDSSAIDILIDVYLIFMGMVILYKAMRIKSARKDYGKYAIPLGLVGGFTDAMGGGGWGPVVTSTLLAGGHRPRETIGTVNTVEFFVTIAETTTFVVMLGDFQAHFSTIIGLITGGIIAAPAGAVLCKKLPAKVILLLVGGLVICLNLIKLVQHTGGI